MRYCWQCNAELPDDSLFCLACGAALTETAAESRQEKSPGKRTKKSKLLLPLVIAIAVIAAVALGVVIYKTTLPFSKDTQAIARVTSSVVKICCYDHNGEELATGSGFLAYDDTTVFTNYHVMESAYTCEILTEQNAVYAVESILAYSKTLDIAILKLSAPTGLTPLELGSSEKIEKGSTVIAIGSPLGIQNTVSQGVLSGRITEGNTDSLQFTAPISSGSSGGALFDDDGKVIGITFASYTAGQNLNLAIPIEQATDLYTKRGEKSEVSAIYLEAHPYVPYLEEYEHIVEVSIQDLKNYPDRYHGKVVKVRAFVSSLFHGELRYISGYAYASGNIDADNEYTNTYDFENHPYIYAVGSDECTYEDKNLAPGDPVVIIGEFLYKTAGEVIYVIGDRTIYTQTNEGRIYGKLIYKEP